MAIKIETDKKVEEGNRVVLRADPDDAEARRKHTYKWEIVKKPADLPRSLDFGPRDKPDCILGTYSLPHGRYEIQVKRTSEGGTEERENVQIEVTRAGALKPALANAAYELGRDAVGSADRIATSLEDGLSVRADRTDPTDDQALWVAMRSCFESRTFQRYNEYLKRILCERTARDPGVRFQRGECGYKHGIHAYDLLRAATEVYLLCHACCDLPDTLPADLAGERERLGYVPDPAELEQQIHDIVSAGTLPYLRDIIPALGLVFPSDRPYPFCADSVRGRPCLFELLWSYWLEEGMLVQTLNAVSARFQNRRVRIGPTDALANLDITPLRPLNNLLWGYIQDTQHRLTVARRAYEYDHHYGLRLLGKAVGDLDPADSRSKFLESFHALLHHAADFYRESTNQLVRPDAFPLLNALRAVHVLLAEGAHNQFGDLPSTARAEMMIGQWLLAQENVRQFLPTREMVPYEEPWMGAVDAMKRLVGWTDVSVIHFHRLAIFGERILLTIRYGGWGSNATTAAQAENWARYWRPEIQGYIEAYRAATGVDLAGSVTRVGPVDAVLPSIHLRRRMSDARGPR